MLFALQEDQVMELFVQLAKIAVSLLLALIAGLPLSVALALVLCTFLALLLLLLVSAFSPSATRRILRIVDIFQPSCHCSCDLHRCRHHHHQAGEEE